MGTPYAEVIGDPIAHSKSPLIHRFWLAKLGLEGDYRAIRVTRASLAAHLRRRRLDPDWRGCNFTAPLKRDAVALMDRVEGPGRRIGAVNGAVPDPSGMRGFNTDVDGIRVALQGAEIRGRPVAVIGAGGAARAAVAFLSAERAARTYVLARDPTKAQSVLGAVSFPRRSRIVVLPMAGCAEAFEDSRVIVNATPMGSAGQDGIPNFLLEAIPPAYERRVAFDMVYSPPWTLFLEAARAAGWRAVGGIEMLIGQAATAFVSFFGVPPPTGSGAELREVLSR